MVVVEEVKDGLELGVGVGVGEGRRKEEGGRERKNQKREKCEFLCLGNGNSYVHAYICLLNVFCLKLFILLI